MPRNTANVNQLIDSLKAYEEQQPMLKVLYAELHHYQSLIATAIQHGAFLNPSARPLATLCDSVAHPRSPDVPNDRFDPKRDALATPVIGPLGPIRRSGTIRPLSAGCAPTLTRLSQSARASARAWRPVRPASAAR